MVYFFSVQDTIKEFNSGYTTIQDLNRIPEYFKNITEIGLDCETTGLDPKKDKVVMLQIGDLNNQFVIDTRGIKLDFLKPLLEDNTKTFIGQNIKFDYNMLKQFGILLPKVYDTMVTDQVLFNGKYSKDYLRKAKRFSLKGIYKYYFEKDIEKEVRNEFLTWGNNSFTAEQIHYGAKDIIYPLQIKQQQEIWIKRYALDKTISLENKVLLALGDIEYNGMKIDTAKWKNISIIIKERLKNTIAELDSILIDQNKKYLTKYVQLDLFTGKPNTDRKTDVKWSSDKQVLNILVNEFNIRPEEKDGKLSSSTKALEMLSIQEGNLPIVKTLKKYRKESKVISSFGEKYLLKFLKANNRLHTRFNSVMSTGRISSSNPNLQQIPNTKEFRACFIPTDNTFEIAAADYSAQEQRIIASKSKDENYLNFFNKGKGDIHSFIASRMFSAARGEEVEVVNDESHPNYKLRQQGKILGFMISFGGSAFTLSKKLRISKEEAQSLIDAFFKGFPTLLTMFNENAEFAYKYGYIRANNVTNRLRWLPEWKEFQQLSAIKRKDRTAEQNSRLGSLKGKIRRRALNTPIQGTAGDITKTALILYREYLLSKGIKPFDNAIVKLIGQVHDEIIIEYKKELSNTIVKELENCMIKAGSFYCKGLEMTATAKTGDHWIH